MLQNYIIFYIIFRTYFIIHAYNFQWNLSDRRCQLIHFFVLFYQKKGNNCSSNNPSVTTSLPSLLFSISCSSSSTYLFVQKLLQIENSSCMVQQIRFVSELISKHSIFTLLTSFSLFYLHFFLPTCLPTASCVG